MIRGQRTQSRIKRLEEKQRMLHSISEGWLEFNDAGQWIILIPIHTMNCCNTSKHMIMSVTKHTNKHKLYETNRITHHYKAAVCLQREKLQRRFSAAFQRPNVVIFLGVLHSIITIHQVVNIRRDRVPHGTSLCTMEDKRLLACLNLTKLSEH